MGEKYRCNNCNSNFANKNTLNQHLKRAKFCERIRRAQLAFVKWSILGITSRLSSNEWKRIEKDI